ncbi:siderophore ABC transporter substrate-binding protein [Vibrio sp. HN007]|uniref:siderophore ABC transporter substrate-binding protein n=1 Tax=Vibrio iocasae TaxID=3098914 RepID=UPI0035D4571F
MHKLLTILIFTIAPLFSIANATTVTHPLGTINIDTTPERVVVIGIGSLDVLDYFDIDPIAVSKGVTYPEYLKKYDTDAYPSSGSLFEPDFETIYNLKPDLIIVGSRGAKAYKELSDIAPTLLFAVDGKKSYWQSTQDQWRNIGKVFQIEDQVEKTIKSLDAQINNIKSDNQNNNQDALTVMSSGGNITAFGAKSRFASIYTDFGYTETVEGIKESRHGDLISYEFISEKQPSNLLVVDRDILVNKGKSETRKQFDNDLVKSTPAYKNNRMVFLDINAWYLAIAGVNATKQMIIDMAH